MEQEIIECEENFLQAFRNSDIEACEKVIHIDLIYNDASGGLMNKEMDVNAFRAANPKVEKLDCLERKIQMFDDVAIVSTLLYLKAVFMGEHHVEGKTRFLRTWKKFPDGWKIIAAASININ